MRRGLNQFIQCAHSILLLAKPFVKKHAAILEWLMTDSFISLISLSIPWMNSSMKLMSSSFLKRCRWSSLTRNEKSKSSWAGFFLKISNLSARSDMNRSSMWVSKTSISALFLIEIDTRTLLMLDSIRQCSVSLFDMMMGYKSSLGLS